MFLTKIFASVRLKYLQHCEIKNITPETPILQNSKIHGSCFQLANENREIIFSWNLKTKKVVEI